MSNVKLSPFYSAVFAGRRDNNFVFYKYPSIENSFRSDILDKIRSNGYDKLKYAVTEKIHGANTQIDYNFKTHEFLIGKRETILQDGENFYNSSVILNSVKPKVKQIAEFLQSQLPESVAPLAVVRVYGELFGGSYPHTDVPKVKTANRVQKGVFYCPDNQWAAFDIAYSFDYDKTQDSNVYFLNSSDFFFVCKRFDLPCVPLLSVVGSLDEALQYPNAALSQVYQRFSLPILEDNIMEGVVIRPYDVDLWMGMTRLVLKNKNEKFAERKSKSKHVQDAEVPQIVKQVLEQLSEFVTENRVHNVISHYGPVSDKDIGKLIGLVSQDVLSDYVKIYGLFNLMDKSEEKMVTKQLTRMVAPVVRKSVLGY